MDSKTLEHISELIEKSLYIKEIYNRAADSSDFKGLSDYFRKKSAERKKFSEELIKMLYDLGGKYEENKNLTERKSDLPLGSFETLGDPTDISPQALFNLTISANREILGNYEAILAQSDLPENHGALLKKQLGKTERTVSNIKFIGDI